jgi:hypothetical protein
MSPSPQGFIGHLCRRNRLLLPFVSVALLLFGSRAAADEADDLSGTLDEDLHLMFGKREVWVSYHALFHDDERSCTCLVHGRERGHGRFQFDDDAGFAGVLTRDDNGIRIKLTSPPMCCGAGWPGGLPDGERPDQPPARCTVQRARSYFLDAGDARTGAYVERGDVVDWVPASGHPKLVLARFKGKKQWTLGLLPKADLRCKD